MLEGRLKSDAPVVFPTMHREVAHARRALGQAPRAASSKLDAPEELTQAISAALAGDTFVSPAIAGELLQPARGSARQRVDPVALRLTPRQRDTSEGSGQGACRPRRSAISSTSRVAHGRGFHKYQLVEVLST